MANKFREKPADEPVRRRAGASRSAAEGVSEGRAAREASAAEAKASASAGADAKAAAAGASGAGAAAGASGAGAGATAEGASGGKGGWLRRWRRGRKAGRADGKASATTADGAGRGNRWLVHLLGGDVLASQWVRRQIPLLLLCLVYLLLIVAGRYRVERLSREQRAAQERVEHLREHRILLQERYQQSVKISRIADDLKSTGVGITAGPPYEIER